MEGRFGRQQSVSLMAGSFKADPRHVPASALHVDDCAGISRPIRQSGPSWLPFAEAGIAIATVMLHSQVVPCA
jgi:hypothetical protein